MNQPLTIQRLDSDGTWSDAWHLHARQVNKNRGGQFFDAAADQYRARLDFDVAYFEALDALRYNPQEFQILYRGHAFKVVDVDDFMEQHRVLRLTGEAYG